MKPKRMRLQVILVFMLLFFGQSTVQAQAPTAFSCSGSDGFGYYSSSANSTISNGVLVYANSRISKLTTLGGQRSTLCPASTIGVALNGLAFNPHDNFLYGVSRYDATAFSGTLYQIGENCQKVEIPVIGNIIKFATNDINTVDAAGGNISSATFDLDNNYYVNTSFTLASSTGFTNRLQVLKVKEGLATVQSTVTLTCPSCSGSSRLRVTDIVFDEPSGQLFGSNKELNQLFTIDPATGILTPVGTTGITSSILGIYKNRDGNVRAISENGNIYDVNLTTGAFSLLSSATGLNSNNADAASGCYAPPKITGQLFVDKNGLADNLVNGIGSSTAGSTEMYVNLVQNGIVVKSDALLADGSYMFLGLFSGMYEIQISSIRGTVGQSVPAQNLPSTYAFVGDHTGTGSGSDGSPNGRQTLTIANGQDVLDVNFGINGIPVTTGYTAPDQINPGGSTHVSVPDLTFSDPEESDISNITIETIPDPSSVGTVYYDGSAVTQGQFIPDYTPSLLTVDPVDGFVTVSFTFFTTDMAGFDSNVSVVNLPFSSSSLPVVFSAFSGRSVRNQNILTWTTSSEENTDLFIIEKAATAYQFEEIGRVAATGSLKNEMTYSYTDEEAYSSTYYRLKILDLDGAFEYSPIIHMSNLSEANVHYYPSLVSTVLYIDIVPEHELHHYTIVALGGSIVARGVLGAAENTVNLSSLERGQYYLNVYTKQGVVKTGVITKI